MTLEAFPSYKSWNLGSTTWSLFLTSTFSSFYETTFTLTADLLLLLDFGCQTLLENQSGSDVPMLLFHL